MPAEPFDPQTYERFRQVNDAIRAARARAYSNAWAKRQAAVREADAILRLDQQIADLAARERNSIARGQLSASPDWAEPVFANLLAGIEAER